MQVDPRFQQMGKTARRRRRRSTALRGLAGLMVLSFAGGLGWWRYSDEIGALWSRWTDTTQMTQVASEFDIAPVTHGAGFTDIPGDPMIIPRIRRDEAALGRTVIAPEAILKASSAGTGNGELTVLDTELRAPDRQLVATLPSTREEFAMFQAERSRARREREAQGLAVPDEGTGAAGSGPDSAQPIVSGTVFLRDPTSRMPLWSDQIIETTSPRKLDEILSANGISEAQAVRAAERFQAAFETADPVPPGAVLAMRYRGEGSARQIIQLSLYGPKPMGYLGSMAMAASGQLVPSADAFADQPLLSNILSGEEEDGYQPQRLLDMIYSAALRSDLSPDEAGTALAMMAKIHDLDGFADPADRLTIIRAKATANVAGPLLFIGVNGPSGDKPCHITAEAGGDPACFTPRRTLQAAAGSMVPPVAGVMSQRFVPLPEGDEAKKPPSAETLLRGHVVWSAPQGSPVRAVAAGKVTALAVDPDYGPSVEITHPDGTRTRYRGLSGFDPSLREGADLSAGAEIGKIGKPPGHDQPGLIFQLLVQGTPVDPAARIGGAVEVAGSNAVEALIGRIIRVESAGNARAKNPRSSASGLGQFIESTWLRMMRTYRPDLVASRPRADLLDLRFNPELSREMVRHLAQENEAYLRARGHSITAGRLYLAHFLGPAGADQALRADPGQTVAAVMGPAVMSANPFLRGYSIADLRNWAERKMSGAAPAGSATTAPAEVEVPVSPEVRAFVAALDQIRHAI
ncbi:MAG: peptidoglycan DD-metalloendopeptidase family protein [Paracoccus sp. (in: a-proteobacteria)]